MKKLNEALHVIQDECNKHVNSQGDYDCYACPLCYVDGHCAVIDLTPDNWKINDEVQKALL